MKTSADFVTEVCLVMLVPPVIMVLILMWAGIWIGMFLYVYSIGDIAAAETTSVNIKTGKIDKLPYGKVTLT